MHSEAERVRVVNQRFYEALSAQNLLRLEQLWAHSPQVRCSHPGETMLSGWATIRESWRAVFTRSIAFTIEPLLAEVNIHGPIAVVTCQERISSFTLDGSRVATTLATNIFQKQRGRWLLIHRHASPVAAPGSDPPTS
ncbi:MAG TPA: nuclear transport factor 2 family protein [Candidatus Krumholzibacteria bacterium]|nr:nuclear transport factor 2 family protein [Candidatus Krumholzibacteria bacterium]